MVDRRGVLALISYHNMTYNMIFDGARWEGMELPICKYWVGKTEDIVILGPISLMLSSSLDPEAWIMNRLPIRWPLNGF